MVAHYRMLLHWLKLDIQSRGLSFGDWPEVLYDSNDLRAHFPGNERALSVRIELAESAHAIGIEPITRDNGEFAEIGLFGGMCWFRDGRFYSVCDAEFSSEAEFIPADGRVSINLGGRYRSVSPESMLALVVKQLMQSFALPFYRLKFLHGAAVTRAGRTMILSGPGGAGKTTAALRLLQYGYTLLSDDGPLFTHHDGVTSALSSLDYSQATDRTLELLPFLRETIVGERDHRGKYRLLTRRVQPDESWRQPQRVTHMIHLERRKCSAPHLREIDRTRASAALIDEAMTVFRAPAFAGAGIFRAHSELTFDTVTSLVRDARAYELSYGDEHLDLIPALLGGIDDR